MSERRTSVTTGAAAPGDGSRPRSRGDGAPSPLRLAVVIDEACARVWEAWGQAATVVGLRVSPAVYEAVALARPKEVQRGYPLMLLGLELVVDAAVGTYEPAVVCA
ncbi:MAG TPA: hypothetical protein VFD49_10975 [Candidatus Dormibacteraeota bacterium]|nr:hypothetical protein [Candidatus Dormibacteraeota bacterium]